MSPKKPSATKGSTPDAGVCQTLCSRVLSLRKKRGWTLAEMSAACGVSRSMLSEIERSRANPTLAVAFRISQAFGLSLDELVEAPESIRRIDVIRSNDPSYQFRSDSDCRIRTLFPLRLEKAVEFYEIILRTGGALRSQAHFEGACEMLTVQSGRIKVVSGEDSQRLEPGDSARYHADLPHAIENIGDVEAVAYMVVTYPK